MELQKQTTTRTIVIIDMKYQFVTVLKQKNFI